MKPIVTMLFLASLVTFVSPQALRADDFSQTFGPSDIRTLLTVVHRYLSPDDSTILVSGVPAEKMPAYDPIIHYAGLDATHPHTADVWISNSLQQKDMTPAMLSGVFALAAMDTGDAGPQWKQLYDAAAKADAQLPGNSPDPYANRHKLEADVNQFLQ